MSDGLTPEQRAAIETLDADVCVSAGAGSGKTRVLVERFLRLALGDGAFRRSGVQAFRPTNDERPPTTGPNARTPERLNASSPRAAVDEILAITFTRKAALEMKERIARALVERGRVEERRRLEVGFISTIHTFCERVLRENPFEAGLDPDFAVLDEPESALLLEHAYEQVLEAALALPDDPVAELVHACYDSRGHDGADGVARLRENTAGLLHALSSRGWGPAEVAGWASEPLELFLDRSVALLVEEVNPILGTFRDGIQILAGLTLGTKQMEQNRQALVAALPRLQELPGVEVLGCWGVRDGNDDRRPTTDDRPPATPPITRESEHPNTLTPQHPNTPTPEHLNTIADRLQLLSDLRALLVKRSTKDMDPAAYAAAVEQFEAMKEAHERLKAWAGGWSPERERRAQELARAGVELIARLWHRYEALKRERAALDFNDLQRRTHDLLRDAPAVRDRLRTRLKYLMVDEFQDTDRLQSRILDLLHGERNLFFVGDAKQSIYRFRNADVRLFAERERRLREAEAAGEAARRLVLSVNFRSRPEILEFVNGLFERLWSGADLTYERLTAGRSFDDKPAPSIDLLHVAAEGGVEAVRRAEAREVARRLRELMGSVAITRRDHPRCGEKIRPADVVVLLRTTAVAHFYEQALEEAGLPTFLVGGRHYYARREIRDVVNILKAISRPLEDLAVASALRSPFVGISLDTLSLLSIQAREEPEEARSLYAAIRPALDCQPIAADDAGRLRDFLTLTDRLRAQEDRLPVGAILETLLMETGYVIEVLRRQGGRRTFANVRKLQQMALARPGAGVLEFVERIEQLTRVSEREGDAPTHAESADVVRLMTVHQAKGLEFPVVVLPDLGRRQNSPTAPLLALDADARHAACRVWDKAWHETPLHHRLAAADTAADAEESLRLLYVALTRAEEHLVLAGPRPAAPGTWAERIWNHAAL